MTADGSELLKNYKNNINQLRIEARNLNLSENEIDQLFEDCFNTLNPKHKCSDKIFTILKVMFIIIISLFLLTFVLNHHQPTLSLVLRNVQGFIYPGFKLLRLLAIPIIRTFPSLTELYDEICLIENPYFEVSNMDCWPCEQVHSVINLTDIKHFNLYQLGVPYVFRSLNKSVPFTDVQDLYRNNSEMFDSDSGRVKSNSSNFTKTEDLLNFNHTFTSTHISWRINRMAPARVIRKLFPKPDLITQWSGQSTERYVMIDGCESGHYVLPNPECSYVLLTQGSGERTVILKPSKECALNCRPISVVLKASYSLWYNWWYWKPISYPTPESNNVSITYITSYC